MIGPGGLLLVVLLSGVGKEYVTKLGCEKYFLTVTY
jgi:hypothetical protein